jgi:hypothetical protein
MMIEHLGRFVKIDNVDVFFPQLYDLSLNISVRTSIVFGTSDYALCGVGNVIR